MCLLTNLPSFCLPSSFNFIFSKVLQSLYGGMCISSESEFVLVAGIHFVLPWHKTLRLAGRKTSNIYLSIYLSIHPVILQHQPGVPEGEKLMEQGEIRSSGFLIFSNRPSTQSYSWCCGQNTTSVLVPPISIITPNPSVSERESESGIVRQKTERQTEIEMAGRQTNRLYSKYSGKLLYEHLYILRVD